MPLKWQAGNHQRERLLPKYLAFVSANDIAAVRESADEHLWDLTVTQSVDENLISAASAGAAVVLLDSNLTGDDWRSMVVRLTRHFPDACIILASTVPDDYLFEEAVKQGAFDVITLPLRTDELRRISGLALAFWNHRHLPPVK